LTFSLERKMIFEGIGRKYGRAEITSKRLSQTGGLVGRSERICGGSKSRSSHAVTAVKENLRIRLQDVRFTSLLIPYCAPYYIRVPTCISSHLLVYKDLQYVEHVEHV